MRPTGTSAIPSWYSYAQRHYDEHASGPAWRCSKHGRTSDPLLVLERVGIKSELVPYCAQCDEVLLLVSENVA